MAIGIVDALEAIDIDHQAGDRAGMTLRARQLLAQALLQIAPVVPTGQEIRDAGPQQAVAVDGIFEAHRGDRAQDARENRCRGAA
jgi:hypothetical protein